MKRIFSWILILVLVFSFLGCEKNVETGEEPTAVVYGEAINLQMRQPDTFDPILTQRESVRDILLMAYEPLFNITERFECEKVLAENYAFNENATILTVRLKEGVFWHDGTPFIADDVVYTANKIMQSPLSSYHQNLKWVQRVEKLSDYEVAFYLTKSDAQFIYALYFPIENRNYDPNIINGTGAYLLTECDGKSLRLMASDTWHMGKAETEIVNVIYMRTALMAQEAFSSGKIHALTMDMIDTENFPIKESNTRYFYPDGTFEFVGFNTKQGIFTDPLLRMAASNAINRGELEKIYSDATASGFPVMTGSSVFSPSYEMSEFNLDYAKELIFSAGWVDMDYDLLPEKVFDGRMENMEFTLLCATRDAKRQEAAKAIKKQLEAAQFTVHVEFLDVEEFNRRISHGEFEAYIASVYYDKPYDVYEFLSTNGKMNYQNFSSRDMDEALTKFSQSTDIGQAQAAFYMLGSVYTVEQPMAGLVFRNSYVVTNKYIEGEVDPYPYSPYANIHKWIVK